MSRTKSKIIAIVVAVLGSIVITWLTLKGY